MESIGIIYYYSLFNIILKSNKAVTEKKNSGKLVKFQRGGG